MSGIRVFPSLADANRAGFHCYDRREDGYLMRIRTSAGFAFAIALLGDKVSDLKREREDDRD